jgi:hypothetical protein
MARLCAAGAGGVRVARALERVRAGALRLDAGPAAVPPVAGRAHACRRRPHAAPPGRRASGCCQAALVGHAQTPPQHRDGTSSLHAQRRWRRPSTCSSAPPPSAAAWETCRGNAWYCSPRSPAGPSSPGHTLTSAAQMRPARPAGRSLRWCGVYLLSL